MAKEQRPTKLSRGESVIRSAFRRSLLLFLLLFLLISGFVAWLAHEPLTEPIEEQPVRISSLPATTASAKPPEVAFTDITLDAGIEFVHVNGAFGERLMPETIGSGAAFLDYDNDGDQDLLLLNGKHWPGHESARAVPRQALYQNDGTGRFHDVSREAGLDIELYAMGPAIGDFDNDGWIDLFIGAVGGDRLLRNMGGRFVDVTANAGVGGPANAWSSSAAFLDYDNDGDLDLFVGNYVKWSRDIDLEIDFRLTGLGRAYGAPDHFVGSNSRLYRNDGDMEFSDVSAAAGILVNDPVSGLPQGKALGVRPVDYDRDGWMDLLVANDTTRNFLFHNLRDGRFEEVGDFEGVAYDRDGKATSGMGIDSGYFRNDIDLGVVIGNFANEMSSLYVTADGRPPFADEAVLEGLGPPSRLALTFGVLFLDYDLDGRLDLLAANGHLEHEINRVQPSQTYAQPPQLLWNCGEACRTRFIEVKQRGALSRPLVGRAAAFADIDADGDLDLLLTQNGRRPALIRNDQRRPHHWLRLKLVGSGANRSAIGARVELQANGITQRRELVPTRSFLSQVELPLTFGLGSANRVDSLTIYWPGNPTQEVEVGQVDRLLIVEQPNRM